MNAPTVRVWDGQSGECVLGPLRGHDDNVYPVAISHHGNRIVSGSGDKTVRVWDGQSGECVLGPLRGHDDYANCVAISADGSRIVSCSDDETVRVWDGQSGECVKDAVTGLGKCGGVNCAGVIKRLEYDAGSDLCVVHTSGRVFLLDTSTGTKMERPGYMHESNCRIYATGQNAKTVQVATMPFECFSLAVAQG